MKNQLSRYKKLMLALAAIASIYLVKTTGLDQGLIDEVLDSLVEAVTEEAPAELPAEVELPAEAGD